jgi:hypothetical protein
LVSRLTRPLGSTRPGDRHFFFAYSLTLRPLITGGVSLRQAARVAFAADTVSIAVMEIVDNGFVLLVPGAMEGARGPSSSGGASASALSLLSWRRFRSTAY